jgi:hypothetical protein
VFLICFERSSPYPPVHYLYGSTSDSTFSFASFPIKQGGSSYDLAGRIEFCGCAPIENSNVRPQPRFSPRFGRKDLCDRRIFHGKAQFSGEKALKKRNPALSSGSSAGARA